jgi:tetratricopeptide (TPR) repeat protein
MRNEGTKLDPEELMHLAMHAENHEQAIGYLKQLLEISTDNAKAYYMLGAIHAQIGMYDRAAEEMTKAVELEPELFTAHFQLGLLHVTSGRVPEAEQAWSPLDKLGESNPLYLFKRGILHLVEDKFKQCIEDLNKGIALNSQNEALNNDMRKIISQAEELYNKPTNTTEQNQERKDGNHHILLSAYQNDNETEH